VSPVTSINGTPFDLPAGSLGFALGGQYINESFDLDYDGLTKQGQVPGLNPAFPTPRGVRERWAGFAEVRIPVLSEKQNVPGFYSFEIGASGRYENLDPGGSSAVPKVSFRWQPIEKQLTLRGTYSQGFVAPSMYTLFGAPLVNNPTIRLPNGRVQEQVMYISNPKLPSADSENYTLGLVYSPEQLKHLTVSVDYYRINLDNQPYNPDPNAMAASLNAASAAGNPQASPWYSYYTKPNVDPLQPYDTILHGNFGNLRVPNLPGAATRTEGLDIALNYELPTETAGKFNFFVNANVLFRYDFRAGPDEPFYSYKGQYTDPAYLGQGQGTLPDYMIIPGMSWEYRNFTYTVTARYIPSVWDYGDNHPYEEGGVLTTDQNGATVDGSSWKVSDWYSIDMQLAYEFNTPTGFLSGCTFHREGIA
jgi:iron complex outermembrane receptor protein